MENEFSKDFQKYFLLKFTKELIWYSGKKDIVNLQKIIQIKEESIAPIKKISSLFALSPEIPPQRKIISHGFPQANRMKMPIRRMSISIPESKLPEHLEYLKPVPKTNMEIDLFKLTPLINDAGVRIIEVNPEEKVIVNGTMGTKPTSIILNKEEINKIINKFSEISKIPANEGIYKVVVGNLILSAIISDMIGSRFVIKKMMAPQEPPYPNRRFT
jgi:hypothetical protein